MGIWRTAEGEDIPFSELSDDHLVNIVHFLEKKAPEQHEKRLDRFRSQLASEMKDFHENTPLWMDVPSHLRRRFDRLSERIRHIEKQDPRNPQPFAGAGPYRELVKMAIKRGLLPEGYTWRTPIDEQEREFQKMIGLAAAYGHRNPMEVVFGARQQGKTSALEQAVLDARIKMAELQANPLLVLDHAHCGDSAIRFVPHQGIQPGDAIMISGLGGPFFVGNVFTPGGKPVPRSTTRKLRK